MFSVGLRHEILLPHGSVVGVHDGDSALREDFDLGMKLWECAERLDLGPCASVSILASMVNDVFFHDRKASERSFSGFAFTFSSRGYWLNEQAVKVGPGS